MMKEGRQYAIDDRQACDKGRGFGWHWFFGQRGSDERTLASFSLAEVNPIAWLDSE
jgi:hypothetical protein